MYTLYYLNRNLQIGTIKADTLDVNILIPEDLIFCDLRKGIEFIKQPHKCIAFTDFERLIIQSEFNDTELISQGEYRKANTYLTPLCEIDLIEVPLNQTAVITQFTADKFKITYNPNVKNRQFTCGGSLNLIFRILRVAGFIEEFPFDIYAADWPYSVYSLQKGDQISFGDNWGEYLTSDIYIVP